MLHSVILGIVQGITEFLPISSSGHLVLLAKFFEIKDNVILINLILHVGTAFAMIWFFWKDILNIIKNKNWVLVKNLFIAFLITAFFAFLLKNIVENIFIAGDSVVPVAWAFVFTAMILLMLKKIKDQDGQIDSLKFFDLIKIGLAQAIAIIPGISRSGMTYFAATKSGLEKEEAFKFSFLLAIPTILGAAFIEFIKNYKNIAIDTRPTTLLLGLLISFIFGILSLWLFKYLVKKSKLWLFSFYLIILAVLLLIL